MRNTSHNKAIPAEQKTLRAFSSAELRRTIDIIMTALLYLLIVRPAFSLSDSTVWGINIDASDHVCKSDDDCAAVRVSCAGD